ncbi:hypothetical protein EGY05_16050 [Chryseobacterium arthrosphaerae]|uniref:hypothetical protein n=1 Tax=Chryseobacterium arthrosphaerae TaxID=651561 RepID=UPI000F50847B|nr:hypothetical protein [Chryseobacterium arthrosphaerae]AYZ13351.1 hypothetical protein EGY05_16050 [Chryseobacterium arthrosphaerae]MDG4654261.1 hypothetical protein [Chryseobacterium arthrosphaerae]QUY54178.1 hypothetical protein I2F65_14945 [Chryseobacterium arthrosphaerae]
MKNYQKNLFDLLLKESGGKKNLVDVMIDKLALSNDTAYRRISGKSHITLNEGISLASHFGISLDLIHSSHQNNVVLNKTHDIYNMDDLETYFESSIRNLQKVKNKPDVEFIYAAKDIPLFYFMRFENLRKFKIYAWLKLMDVAFFSQRINFENFEIPENITRKAILLSEAYNDVSSTEIWSNVTIYTLLEQIIYFHQLELITTDSALKICKEIVEMLNLIEEKIITEQKTPFKLYQNDLLIMNNSVFIRFSDQKMLFLPYNILSYYYTLDERVCRNYEKSLELILKNSELLSANNKARYIFFNKMYKKIEEIKKLLQNYDQ